MLPDLRCPPEVAFDYLSDHRAELEWNAKCESMEKLTEGPVGLGTKYRARWKRSPYVELETVASSGRTALLGPCPCF